MCEVRSTTLFDVISNNVPEVTKSVSEDLKSDNVFQGDNRKHTRNEEKERMPEIPMSTHVHEELSIYTKNGVQKDKPIIEGNKPEATGRPDMVLHRFLSHSTMNVAPEAN